MDSPPIAELSEVVRDKLGSIVSDYLIGEHVPADDVFPDELLYFFIGDVRVGF